MATPETPDWDKLLKKVVNVAETVTPLLQGTPAGAVVAVGKSVLDLIDEVQAVASADDVEVLAAKRADLEPLVLAHLDRTIASLG